MSAGAISGQYVRYIGAGAVAAGGILSMLNALPLIFASVAGSLRDLRSGEQAGGGGVARTDRDLPMPLVLVGTLGLVLAIAASHLIPTEFTGRLIGARHDRLVRVPVRDGQLANHRRDRLVIQPDLGMTIATLLLTCLIFVVLGWVGPEYRLTALSIAGVVCIASSNGGTTSQDLKTGFLVGATPWKQQVSILVGALISAVFMGGTLLRLNGLTRRSSSDPGRTAHGQGPRRRDQGNRDRSGWKELRSLVGRRIRSRACCRASTWSTNRARPST